MGESKVNILGRRSKQVGHMQFLSNFHAYIHKIVNTTQDHATCIKNVSTVHNKR